jgi:hypothetical protein
MFLILRRIKRVILQVIISPCAVPIINLIFCGTLIIWTRFRKILKYQFLRKSYRWNISMRVDERTDRHGEVYRHFLQFCEDSNK